MYTNKEIRLIVENCNTSNELLHVCKIFSWLIFLGDMKKNFQLNMITHLKFRELENLKL